MSFRKIGGFLHAAWDSLRGFLSALWDSLWGLLSALWDVLGRIPSLGWGIMYLALIFVFAVIYTCNSDGFYHSTSQYESDLDLDADDISRELEALLLSRTVENQGHYNGWTLNREHFSIHSLKPSNEGLKFSVTSHFNSDEGALSVDVELSISILQRHLKCDNKNETCVSYKSVDLVRPLIDKQNGFVTLVKPFLALYDDIDFVELPVTLEQKILDLIKANQGFPSGSSGSFSRMLYLSAVTITTLGYGDIVPITDWNRFYIALESVLGVVFIGLFLNSLTRERLTKL